MNRTTDKEWYHFPIAFAIKLSLKPATPDRQINRKLYQVKIWSSHLLDNLSNCLINLKNSGDSTGFEPMTSAMPVQCSNQLSYEVTQWRAGQFVGLTALHITFLSYDIPFTGKHEPNKLTCSPLCGFIAQLVRALHRHRRGHGFESRWVTWIFQVYETIA